MSPEQAAGDVERVNRQADVFGLGSILCEILTGQPAYTGIGPTEVLHKAMRGETADALARLGGCQAEPDLLSLAKDCLEVQPDDRPRDAGFVAERITAYLANVQDRVQAAERERAVAVARAIEERRRRKVQLALAASVLALTTLGGLSTTYYLQQRAARAAAADRLLGRAITLRDQALMQPDDLSRWQVALAAVEQADSGLDATARDRLLDLRTEIEHGHDAAQRDRTLLDQLVDIRSSEGDDQGGSLIDRDYAEAFRRAGIDVASLSPSGAGADPRPPAVSRARRRRCARRLGVGPPQQAVRHRRRGKAQPSRPRRRPRPLARSGCETSSTVPTRRPDWPDCKRSPAPPNSTIWARSARTC